MLTQLDIIKILSVASGVPEDQITVDADVLSETYNVPLPEGTMCFYQHPKHGICTDLWVKRTSQGIERDNIDWMWGDFNVETARHAIQHFQMTV